MDHGAPLPRELPFDPVEPASSSPGERPIGISTLIESIPSTPTADARAARQSPRFAGLTYGQLAIGALLLAAAIWSMWATSRIFVLENRKVVSVRLAAIVNDFVIAESRSGTPPEQLAPRTRAFMLALDTVLKKRAASGQVVLVGEAVVASSVPDVTADVVADLARIVKQPVAAAMPPAMPSLAPSPTPVQPLADPAQTAAARSPFQPAPDPNAALQPAPTAEPQP